MTLDDLNTNIRNLVRTLLAMPDGSVRPANQNAPTGNVNQPFATVLVTPVGSRGWDDRSTANANDSDDVTEVVTGQRNVVASVQFFRAGALDRAHRLKSLLQRSSTADILAASNIGFVRAGDVTNVTAVVDTNYEERSQLELEFHLITEEQERIHTFGTFPVSVVDETHHT